MKNILYILVIQLILWGCAPEPYLFYQSEATLEHVVFTKYSSLHLVDADVSVKNKLSFDKRILNIGVFAGIDLPNTKYIVLAPAKILSESSEFDNYFLQFPVFIKETDLKDLEFFTNKIIDNWDITIPYNDGQFYNYSIAPLKSVTQVDSSSFQYYTTFQINFQRTTKGNIVMFLFSNDKFQSRMEIRDKASLEVFLNKIVIAKKYLSIDSN